MFLIEQNKCIGCGACVSVCPEGIEMADSKAVIKNENASCLEEARQACPADAIIMDKNQTHENSVENKIPGTEKENEQKDFNEVSNQNFTPGQGRGDFGRGGGRGTGMGRGLGRGGGRGMGGGMGRGLGRGGGRGMGGGMGRGLGRGFGRGRNL